MTSPIRYDLGADRVVTVAFDAPDAAVNTMTEAWIKAFHETLDRLEAERERYDGVILASAKKTFFAGTCSSGRRPTDRACSNGWKR